MRPMYRHVESPPNIWSWICSPGLWDCRFGYQCLYCPKGIHRLVELGDVWFTLLLPVRYGHVSSIWLYVSAEEPFPICIESKHFRFIPYYELLNTVTQGSLKYDPGTKSISVTWKCDWNALLASTPGLISQRYWEEGPAGGLISPQPQCDSVARSSLRITHQLIESWQQSLGVFLFLFYGLGNGDSKENVKLYNLNQDLNSVSKSCTQIWGYSFFSLGEI